MAVDNQELLKQIGERIRDKRTAIGMSQAELAVKAGLALPRISKIEHAKVEMKLTTFIKIAEALQVSTDELIQAIVPTTGEMNKAVFSDILSDCTLGEQNAIIATVKQMKTAMRVNQDKE